MTWGPALATRAFDPPLPEPSMPPPAPGIAAGDIVQRLDAILQELRARGA
jgi:hypothetical protein